MLGGALGVFAIQGAGGAAPVADVLVGIGVVSIAAASLGVEGLLGVTLLGFGAAFLMRLLKTGVDTGPVIGFAAGLLVACELAAWAGSLGRDARIEPRVVAFRTGALVAAAAIGALGSLLALLGGGLQLPAALAAALVGTIAAVALLAVVNALAHRAHGAP